VQRLMDDLPTRPAYVLDLRWDVVAWNAAADRLFDFTGRKHGECNFMRMVFADPELRRRLPSWREDAPRLLSHFRCDLAVAPDDPAMRARADELRRLSPDFRRWWDDSPPVDGYQQGVVSIIDPGDTVLRFRHVLLTVDEYRHLRMVTYFEE